MQDVVARRGKMIFLFKRPGHRVIINARGDLIVRPTYAEASVQRTPGGEASWLLVGSLWLWLLETSGQALQTALWEHIN